MSYTPSPLIAQSDQQADAYRSELDVFEADTSPSEAIDRVLAVGKYAAKQERMAKEKQVRQDAGARGFLRASSSLYGGLKAAGLDYTRKLASIAVEAITADAEILQAELSRDLGEQLTTARIVNEREVMGIRLEGERQRAELGLGIERDVQLIDLDSDKAASLVKLDYKEQESRLNLEATKVLERLKTTEEIKTIEAVQTVELEARKAVQQLQIQGEYDAETAKFEYESEAKTLTNDAKLLAAGNESSAKLASAKSIADTKNSASTSELTEKLMAAASLNATENQAILDKSTSKITEINRIATAKYDAATTVGDSRIGASRTEGKADIRSAESIAKAQLGALNTSLSTRLTNRKLINAERLATLKSEGGGRITNQFDLNTTALSEKYLSYTESINNRKIAETGRLNALDISNAGKFRATTDQGTFEDGVATTKAAKQLEAAGIKITAKEDSSAIERNLNTWLAEQLGNYSEGAADGRQKARITALTDKLANDLGIFNNEYLAEIGNQGRISAAKIGAITSEATVELDEFAKIKKTELDTEQDINDARLTDAKDVSKAQLDSLEKNNTAQAYANGKNMAAATYTRGASLKADADIGIKRALSNADIRGWELYSQLYQKLRDANMDAYIAADNRVQKSVEVYHHIPTDNGAPYLPPADLPDDPIV